MNLTRSEGLALVDDLLVRNENIDSATIILGVPFPFLSEVADRIKGLANVHLAAQNCHQEESGAFTGEVSAKMLKSFGAEYVILGHSERRAYFEEDDALILKKMKAAIGQGLKPIYCCGERQEHREAGRHFEVVEQQLN